MSTAVFSTIGHGLIPTKVVSSQGAGRNSAPDIQEALDSGKGSPVDVYLPDPLYEVWPASTRAYPGNDSLRINYSNVQLRGNSRFQTTIACKVTGGLDPNTHWELPGGVVWRGNGIQIVGANIANTRIADLRLTGSSPRNLTTYPVWGIGTPNSAPFPADPITGEGWDLTNKGINLGVGTTRTNTLIEDCEIDSFRGELFYYGGSNGNQNLRVRRCIVHDSIASMLSCSGALIIEDNEFYYGLNAVENTPLGDAQIIRDNWIHDCPHGISIPSNASPPANGAGRCVIYGNRIVKSYIWAMYVAGPVRGVWVHDNETSDCPNYGGLLMGGGGPGNTGPQDITVERNLFRLETYAGPVVGINANSDLGYPVTYRIINNRSERSMWAKANGYAITGLVKVLSEPSSVCYESGNDWSGGEA